MKALVHPRYAHFQVPVLTRLPLLFVAIGYACSGEPPGPTDTAKKEGKKVLATKGEEFGTGFAEVLCAGLFFKEKPQLNKMTILKELQKRIEGTRPLDGKEDEGLLAFTLASRVSRIGDRQIPAQCFVTPTERPYRLEDYAKAIEQSWRFPECRTVLKECREVIYVTDLLARNLPYKERLNSFNRMVAAVLAAVPGCQAIHWQASQQFVEPAAYLKDCGNTQPGGGLMAAINVRFYNISNQQDGDMIMDTMGLGALGLSDLQCHFRGLDPQKVAGVLYSTAYYLFDKGSVIESGHTVQGITKDDKWKCRLEPSLLEPKRAVIDIAPASANAAGKRN